MHWAAIVRVSQKQPTTPHLAGRQSNLANAALQILGDRGRPSAFDDFIGNRAQRRTAPSDRYPDFAGIEEIVVVLGVADSDRVVNRQP